MRIVNIDAFLEDLAKQEISARCDISVLIDNYVVDAVEVVRCKDCKWIDVCKDPECYEYKGPNGYCSRGERKQDDET